MKTIIHPPLSNVQIELLRLFSAEIPEKHLLELKTMMASYLLEKAQDTADSIWVERGYSDEKLLEILNKK
jgi:hypothetical protein